ncbi:MAG TPA: ABC transporter permease subunit [Micromonosporaceae bacterium]|nr:ABC transporter permease subunit [Micromonosporaceae bacterium]
MIANLRAELIRLGRWPTTWVLGGTWLLLNLIFGYLFPYLSYRSEGDMGFASQVSDDAMAASLLAEMLPHGVPATMVAGLPMFGGALLLILGATAVGSGYGWGTWKTMFTTGPRRATVLAGTVAALGVALVALVLATLGLDVVASLVVANLENQAVVWPALIEVLKGLGAALLIGGMWITAGVLLGTLTRGPALAVGLGLVWALVVENLLRGVAALLGPIEALTKGLPGTAAGSLAGALGVTPQGQPNGTPGVLEVLGGGTSVLVLCLYVAGFVAISMLLTQRRDIAG